MPLLTDLITKITKHTKNLCNYLAKESNIAIAAVAICIHVALYGSVITAFYRAPISDEAFYLLESVVMHKALLAGKWIGSYGVGMHGFLFKLPAALIYFFTGPSIEAATLYNVVLAVLTCSLYFLLLRNRLKLGWWSIACLALFATSQRFLLVTPTFLREIPLLLALIVSLYIYFNVKNRFIVSIWLTVLLDAKEYVFIAFAFAIVIYELIELIQTRGSVRLANILTFIKKILLTFSLPILFTVVMFVTNLIPLNIYLAYATMLTRNKNLLTYTQNSLAGGVTAITNDLAQQGNGDIVAAIQSNKLVSVNNTLGTITAKLVKTGYDYLLILLHTDTFGWMSLPFIVIIPSTYYALVVLSRKSGYSKLIKLMSVFQLSYLIFYSILHHTNRYLIPLYPTTFMFLILFFKSAVSRTKATILLALILITSAIQLRFDDTFVTVKIAVTLVLAGLLVIILFARNTLARNGSSAMFTVLYCVVSLAITYKYLWSPGPSVYGQAYLADRYGYLLEYDSIAKLIDTSSKIIVPTNMSAELLAVFREDTSTTSETFWGLKDWVPAKKHQKALTDNKTLFIKPKHYTCEKTFDPPEYDALVFVDLEGYEETATFAKNCAYDERGAITVPMQNKRVYILNFN